MADKSAERRHRTEAMYREAVAGSDDAACALRHMTGKYGTANCGMYGVAGGWATLEARAYAAAAYEAYLSQLQGSGAPPMGAGGVTPPVTPVAPPLTTPTGPKPPAAPGGTIPIASQQPGLPSVDNLPLSGPALGGSVNIGGVQVSTPVALIGGLALVVAVIFILKA